MVIDQEDSLYRKAAHYCGYQERTEKEVQGKLCAWGVEQKSEEERIIQALKADNFLNEERYVEAFIRGKFLGKQWGKRKILAALDKKGVVDQALIQKGIATIETTDYLQTLRYVADRKTKSLAREPSIQKRQKLTNYLLQKGYEPDLVYQTVQELVAQQQS
jgi:regulatory protein